MVREIATEVDRIAAALLDYYGWEGAVAAAERKGGVPGSPARHQYALVAERLRVWQKAYNDELRERINRLKLT